MAKDIWSHSYEWDLGYAKGHKDGYEQGRADERARINEILDNADDSKNAMYLLCKYLIEKQLKEKK